MKTYNVELTFPSPQDHQDWLDFLKVEQDIFNEISEVTFNEKTPLSLKLVHDRHYYKLREKYPTRSSQMIIKSEQAIIASYRTIQTLVRRKLQKPLEQPILKKNLCMRLDKTIYSRFSKESISLISSIPNHRISVKLKLFPKVQDLFETTSFKDPLIFERDRKLFLAVTFDVPSFEVPKTQETILGVDLGCRRLVVTSDGLMISGKEFLKHKRRIRYNKRMLQSKNTKSSKKHLKKEKKHEANFSKNYTHHVANEILKTDKTIIVLEDLTKIKQNTKNFKNTDIKNSRHNNRMGQIPFYLLKMILTYKALHLKKRVETVNPAYTSQDDYRNLGKGIRKGCRYQAVDGVVLDADGNAANNIALRYDKHLSSFFPAYDGSYKLRKQGSVNSPNEGRLKRSFLQASKSLVSR